jgi:hypothetical protein
MSVGVRPTARITPKNLTKGYRHFYQRVHGKAPHIRHMGGQWYNINGEIVHHRTLMEEVQRLRKLSRQFNQPEKRLLVRVIERLRRL